jgi:3-deoxy-D-manno-octulosonic-acid transferase
MTVTGSIKFDLELPSNVETRGRELKNKISGDRVILVAASTHEGEEEVLLDACVALWRSIPHLLLVLVPRHPHRFDLVANLVESKGIQLVRHSDGTPCTAETQVLLGDTMGELLYFYGIADFAFVGGSLVPVGGHNLMEAASFGLPMMMGPHRFSIEEISQVFKSAGAMVEVGGAVDVIKSIADLVDGGERSIEMGQAAREVMARNRGALKKVVGIVEGCLVDQVGAK